MKTVALIPAAGSSSRFRELGKHYAKTVLPFQGRPIIAHIVDRIVTAEPGIVKIFIVVNNLTHRVQIEEALATSKFAHDGLCVVCDFNEDDIPIKRGPAKTICAGIEHIKQTYVDENVNVLVHLSDSLFSVLNIEDVIRASGPSIGIQEVEDQHRWCVISDNGFFNKPTTNIPGAKALSGLYKFDSNSIDLSRVTFGDTESQISDLLGSIDEPISEINAPIELDFGTLEEYIANRGITITRSFNEVIDMGNAVLKTTKMDSHPEFDEKLRREIYWYCCSPSVLKPFQPAIYEHSDLNDTRHRTSVLMEKIKGVNLRDLALYLDRSRETWSEIFGLYISGVYRRSRRNSTSYRSNRFWSDIFKKTNDRSDTILFSVVRDVSLFLSRFQEFCQTRDKLNNADWIHGDLHFANMFYDLHHRELKMIDPRGDLCGDLLYDLAKLNHSVNGNYDCIDNQLYYFDQNGEAKFFMTERAGIVGAFEKMLVDLGFEEKDRRELDLVTASLFLSMIPLHSHNAVNQRLFYKEFERFFGMYLS